LVDTAGLRESDERIERLGIEVARRYLERADLIVLCVDAAATNLELERAFLDRFGERTTVVVRTKSDLVEGTRSGRSPDALDGLSSSSGLPSSGGPKAGVRDAIDVSVVSGQGLAELKELLPALVYAGLVQSRGDAPVLTRARQTEAVRTALAEVSAFIDALVAGVPAELASTHLRPAETALEELLGVISPEDVLDRLFREFCIGK
jgi:tRNA modification GTPase